MSPKSPVVSLIETRTEAHPDEVFLKMRPDVRVTWGEFHEMVLRAARGLYEAGVRPGDRVALMLPNCPEFFYVDFGVIAAGASPVPINTAQRGETLRFLLEDSGARAIVIDESLWDQYQPLRDRLDLIEVVRGNSAKSAQSSIRLDDLLTASADEVPIPDDAPLIGVLYTSGTTGPPKGVVQTRSDPMPLIALWQSMGAAPGETIYTCLPLFHGNAIAISVLGAMFLDAKIAVSERFSASKFWDEVREFEAVEFNHVGAIIPILMKQLPRPDDADNPMRVVLSNGCPQHLWEDFEKRFGLRVVEFFGMTDSPGYLVNHDGKVGSMGKPVGGLEAAVVDDEGNELPNGQIGELVMRAAEGRTHFYLNRPDATDEAYRNEWFHTGDLASRDEEGFFYYAGRKKESMRRRGENVSAWEIENVLNQHPLILDSAAHAVPSEVGEDDIKVVLVLQPGASLEPAELLDFCAGQMAYYAVPRYVEFRAEIPKTPTERPRYAELKEDGITPSTWDREAAGYRVTR